MSAVSDEHDFLNCPITGVQKVIRGKWTMVILYFLSQQVLRFGELDRKMPMVTQAYLTKELRLLEDYGLVQRHVYPEVPPRVEYSLTAMGQKFVPVLKALEQFATEYHD